MAKLKVPYLVMREGRPRWVPGARVRARGFKGRDLKYPSSHPRAGEWMDEGDAIAAARQINETLAAEPQPAAMTEDRTFRGLFQRIRASKKFSEATGEAFDADAPRKVGMEKLRIGARTRADYLRYMRRMEDDWCGDIPVTDLTPEMVEDFYFDQAEEHGLAQANHYVRTLKMALNIAIKKMRWLDFNAVSAIKIISPDGRLEIFEPAEIAAVIGAADWCGLNSIADAFVIGVLGGPRKQDILALPEGELADGHYVIRQQKKRGVRAFVPITQPLLLRVNAMRARKAARWPGVRHTLEVINSRTGLPYPANAKAFGEDWRLVRAVAAGDAAAIAEARLAFGLSAELPFTPVATIRDKLFSDTRDTAVTMLVMAGCEVAQIANITGHSLKTVQMILDKHYFKRNAELARIAGNKLDAYLAASPIRWA